MCCVLFFPVFVAGGFIGLVLLLATLRQALDRCARRNQTMHPGLVWLNLVPLFNVFWCFPTILGVGRSLRNEFADRGLDQGGSYGTTLGISGAGIGIVGGVVFLGIVYLGETVQGWPENVFVICILVGLAMLFVSFLLGLVYWIRIADYARRLRYEEEREEEREDDWDDEPPPPRGPTSTDITA